MEETWVELLAGIYLYNAGYSFIGWDIKNKKILPSTARPDFFIISTLMFFEAKSENKSISTLNSRLRVAHSQLFKNKVNLNPTGGISVWDTNYTLYIAWIHIYSIPVRYS